jgi:hypothetical protein
MTAAPCEHDVDVRVGDRVLTTPEDLVPVVSRLLITQVTEAVQVALAPMSADAAADVGRLWQADPAAVLRKVLGDPMTVATMLPATCNRCQASCLVEATLTVRDGKSDVSVSLAAIQ